MEINCNTKYEFKLINYVRARLNTHNILIDILPMKHQPLTCLCIPSKISVQITKYIVFENLLVIQLGMELLICTSKI